MKLKVIIGSTRQGRGSDKAAKWVVSNLEGKAEVEVLDLKDYPLPFMEEAVSPQYNPDRKPAGVVKQWLDKLSDADGLIIVTPEYNRSIPGILKNAIDTVAYELKGKPVGIVAHGSTGGAQAVSHLRGIIPAVLATTVPTVVYLPGMAGVTFNEDGTLNKDYAFHEERLAGALNDQLNEIRSGACKCKECRP
ncbi:MAG: hypothetical protein QG629_596 [Patescibacteria group bacterium]|nr:NAD(P)H-dependent oxidoreductase [Candidatus Saccharibacteria bacterium]MDQ5963514.1 hypothetical protein [Patescibacteria group bacterium]